MATLLILTPLAVEHTALSTALSLPAKLDPDAPFSVHLAVGGHGKVQFALSTQLLIQKHKPDLVICAGAAGALVASLKPGDVVIGETTIEHDFRLRFITRPPPSFPADLKTLETLKRRAQNPHFTVHFGPLASGDEDILDEPRAREVRTATGALAVAWEGAGAARACRLHGVPFIEIRAVTDAADSEAVHAFAENVKSGMGHVAEVIQTLF